MLTCEILAPACCSSIVRIDSAANEGDLPFDATQEKVRRYLMEQPDRTAEQEAGTEGEEGMFCSHASRWREGDHGVFGDAAEHQTCHCPRPSLETLGELSAPCLCFKRRPICAKQRRPGLRSVRQGPTRADRGQWRKAYCLTEEGRLDLSGMHGARGASQRPQAAVASLRKTSDWRWLWGDPDCLVVFDVLEKAAVGLSAVSRV